MDADNDLMDYSLWDLYEMESSFQSGDHSGSTLKKDVVVQHNGLNDRKHGRGIRRFLMIQTHQERLVDRFPINEQNQKERSQKVRDFFKSRSIHDVQSPIIQIIEEKSGQDIDPAFEKLKRFSNFLDWGMKKYPAKHYAVILWGHGEGWLKKGSKGSVHLGGEQLALALKSTYIKTLESKKKIDNFIADSCYMMGAELSFEVAPFVKYISGSSQVQSYLGIPYRRLFYEINNKYPSIAHAKNDKYNLKERFQKIDESEKLAITLPILMRATVQSNGLQGRLDQALPGVKPKEFFTFSSLDTDHLQLLRSRLEAFAKEVMDYILEKPKESSIRSLSIVNTLFDSPLYRSKLQTRDLGAFIKSSLFHFRNTPLEKKSPHTKLLSIQAQNTFIALDKAIVWTEFSHRRYNDGLKYNITTSFDEDSGFRAVGFWFPRNHEQYQKELSSFQNTSFFKYNTFPYSTDPEDQKSNWQKMMELIFKSI